MENYHTIEIPEIGYKSYFPKELNFCTTKQYIDVCRLVYALQAEKIDFEQFKILCVYAVLDIKATKKSKLSEEDELNKWANINQLSELVLDFFKINDKGIIQNIKQDYSHNLIPKFKKYPWQTYYGPNNDFSDITFGQYVDGFTHFIDFSNSHDQKFLYKLLAVFYLPKRVKYNEKDTIKRAESFKYIDIGIVWGFHLIFAAFNKFISSGAIMYAGNEINLSIMFTADDEKSDIPGLGMRSVVYGIAETGIFGNYEAVREQPFWDVILKMYDSTKSSKDLEAKHKETENEPINKE